MKKNINHHFSKSDVVRRFWLESAKDECKYDYVTHKIRELYLQSEEFRMAEEWPQSVEPATPQESGSASNS